LNAFQAQAHAEAMTDAMLDSTKSGASPLIAIDMPYGSNLLQDEFRGTYHTMVSGWSTHLVPPSNASLRALHRIAAQFLR